MSTVVEQQPMEEETNNVPEDETKELANKLRGKPKSGSDETKRVKPKALRKSWKVKQEERVRQEQRKQLLDRVKQEQQEEKERAKEERRRKIKQREENLLKSASYQVINTEKVKKMSKKQRKNVMPLQDLKKLQQPRK